jgi:hypothetical protein
MDEECARCGGKPPDEATFTHTWHLIFEQGADWPFCPDCVEEIRVEEGRVPVADPEVGEVWAPAPRGRG